MKKCNLSEGQIHNILLEEVAKLLENNKRLILNEMALPRKTYKKRIDDLMPQVLENWCLVHYCTVIEQEQYKVHWSGELRVHLLTMTRLSISNNDSKESRLKVLQEIWDENDYGKPEFLNLTVVNKFIEEQIDITSQEYGYVIADCIGAMQNIFNAILSRDVNYIQEYIQTI